MSVELDRVRLFPTDQRDMVPTAVLWAKAVLASLRQVSRAEMKRPARESLTAVVWTLAGAADFDDDVPPDFSASVLAREAGVGDRVWQKRTAWLREHGWLERRPDGPRRLGWHLWAPPLR